MITKYINDSILNTPLTYIAHGVNCQNKMGAGVAKVIYGRYPEVKKEYHERNRVFKLLNYDSLDILGSIYKVNTLDKKIYNLYIQEYYGNDGKKYVNYRAIAECFFQLSLELTDKIIAIPKIGSGLAGGDWKIISQIIDDSVEDRLEVWVYDFTT